MTTSAAIIAVSSVSFRSPAALPAGLTVGTLMGMSSYAYTIRSGGWERRQPVAGPARDEPVADARLCNDAARRLRVRRICPGHYRAPYQSKRSSQWMKP